MVYERVADVRRALRGSAFQARWVKQSRQDAAPTAELAVEWALFQLDFDDVTGFDDVGTGAAV